MLKSETGSRFGGDFSFSVGIKKIRIIKIIFLTSLGRNLMKTLSCATSACRYCGHFIPEGRRGGNCEQLGVPVRGGWKACSLAIPAFAPSWEGLPGVILWQSESLTLSELIPVAEREEEVCTVSISASARDRYSQTLLLAS